MPQNRKKTARGISAQTEKTLRGDNKAETINFRIAAADKAKLVKAAAKNDRSLTQFILESLQSQFQADAGKGAKMNADAKLKRTSRRALKDDKVLFLIPPTIKARLRRSAKKADQNLSQYIIDALFE